MIGYALLDALDEEYILNGSAIKNPERGSLTMNEDSYTFNNRIVPNSALPGSVKLGETRLESRNLTIEFESAFNSDSDFRSFQNETIRQIEKAVYLVDKTNSLRVKIAPLNFSMPYDSGSHKLSSSISLEFALLDPFWEDTTETSISEDLTADINSIGINNEGFLSLSPILEFTAAVPVTIIQAFVDETKTGIEIQDTLFGTVGYEVMTLNNVAGTLTIGDFDRTQSITVGTGFFLFPVGAFTLKIIPDAVCSVIIKYRKRYYL